MKNVTALIFLTSILVFGCGCSQQDNVVTKESHEKALKLAISSAPLLKAVTQGNEFKDLDSALNAKFQVNALPRVGGGEIYKWVYIDAPTKSWMQVEHIQNSIFKVSMQIGLTTQQAGFVVDISNGAVEKKYDTFSSQLGY